MKLVHDNFLHIGVRPFAQGDVRQNLSGAAQDRCISIDARIPRTEADILRPKVAAEREPLFIDQRLDRAGVNGTFALRQGLELQSGRHQRFARTSRSVQDDVLFFEQLQHRGFLRRVERDPFLFGVLEETAEEQIIAQVLAARDQIVKRYGHAANLSPGGLSTKEDSAASQSVKSSIVQDQVKQ